jgi:hypothetical protein
MFVLISGFRRDVDVITQKTTDNICLYLNFYLTLDSLLIINAIIYKHMSQLYRGH